MKKLLLVTDAWEPQTNGVVTTLQQVTRHLPEFGFEARVVHPGEFKQVPLPSYPEIRISRNPWKLDETLRHERPDACHVATEGPLGLYARSLFRRRGIPFTTSLHTKFPEYAHQRIRLPLSMGYAFIRWFHRPAQRTLCTTESLKQELLGWGLRNLVVWSRGVDTDRFRPAPDRLGAAALQPRAASDRPGDNGANGGSSSGRRPRLLYVGRIAVEKNVQAFLDLDLDAEKVMVGDGPQRAELEARYPHAQWLGYRKGQPLVDEYAAADAFVFPSRTDTFGLVMLEALACGTPVAAYPVTGPKDVVQQGVTGWLDEDLNVAVRNALQVSREDCRAYAVANGWPKIACRMADNLAVFDWQDVDGR
ncbi:MAG: glycosyltransferase family 1 protein [Gammaproteobacteria bacterium]|nr:glycosyltransferase family 1 protein [Gammaproteobacteria bacterium]